MFFKLRMLFLLSVISFVSYASDNNSAENSWMLLALAIIIGGGSVSWIIKKMGLPSVLGELGLGMIIALLAHYNLWHWHDLVDNPTIALLAEFGSILLLFEIGLESSFGDLVSVGKHGLITAIIGVIVPFGIGAWIVAEWVFHSQSLNLNLFLGATLAATSTGISVRVFKDLGILRNPACQIVLTASIIDDILGLIILAFVSGLVIAGTLNLLTIGNILLNVVIFFVFALGIARKFTPKLINWWLKISNEESMVVAILVTGCLFWAWFAHAIGLATIIGAFVAGLMMDEVVFRKTQQPQWYDKLLDVSQSQASEDTRQMIQDQIIVRHHHDRLIDLIKPINYIFVPIFFVYAGMQVDLAAVANWQTLVYGVALSFAAIVGKVVCGVFLPKGINRWIVGFGMVPRGEIGLIFALTGRQLGVFNPDIFAAVLLMVVITSVVTPIALQIIVKRGIK